MTKSFFPRLIDRCRYIRKALSYKPVDNLGWLWSDANYCLRPHLFCFTISFPDLSHGSPPVIPFYFLNLLEWRVEYPFHLRLENVRRISFNSNVLEKVDAARLQLNFIRQSPVIANMPPWSILLMGNMLFDRASDLRLIRNWFQYQMYWLLRHDRQKRLILQSFSMHCRRVKGLSLRSFSTHCRGADLHWVSWQSEDPSGWKMLSC